MKKFYITTPIYYVNDKPHLGTAYTTISADVLARYHRLLDKNVFFLTGTDEHGLKIQQKAQKLNKNPQDFCDEIVEKFKETWQILNIQYDNFIRTTNPSHKKAVSKVLQKLYENGLIYQGFYQGLYCVGCEQFKTKSDLIEGKCPEHNCIPETRKEKAWLFKMSVFREKILNLIKNDLLKIEPVARKNEVISFLEKKGLEDLAISRSQEKVWWGIPLPFDKTSTTYVWVDAFLNYLTGLGWPGNKDKYNLYWPPDVQLMSKDILRVHATIWPSILLALKEKLPLKIFVHGYLSVDGRKMSKSLGNVVDPYEIARKYGADVLRFYLFKDISFGKDGDFSIKKLEKCYNEDLANDLGNLVQRLGVMVNKYLGGQIPSLKIGKIEKTSFKEIKKILLLNNQELIEFNKLMENCYLDEALSRVWQKVKLANQEIEINKPWVLAKNNPQKLKKVLYHFIKSILEISYLIYPFMPVAAEKIINIYRGPKVKLEKPLFPKIQ